MFPDMKVSICLIVISFLWETTHKTLKKKLKEKRGKGKERGVVEVPQGKMHTFFAHVFLNSKEEQRVVFFFF